MAKIGKNGQKWSKMAKKWSKMAIFGPQNGVQNPKNPNFGPYYRVAPFFWGQKPYRNPVFFKKTKNRHYRVAPFLRFWGSPIFLRSGGGTSPRPPKSRVSYKKGVKMAKNGHFLLFFANFEHFLAFFDNFSIFGILVIFLSKIDKKRTLKKGSFLR